MLGHQFAFSPAPVKRVKEVQFGILSPEEIVRFNRLFAPLSLTSHRKRIRSPKSNIQRLWTSLRTSQRWEADGFALGDDTSALMRRSFEETVEILMEAAAVGEKNDCHGVAENVMSGQMASTGTGAFDTALDIDTLKDAIVDHRLPVQTMMAAQMNMWDNGLFKSGNQAAFSPLAVNSSEKTGSFPYLDPSSPNAYSPTSPGIVQSPFGGDATSSMIYGRTSPFYDSSCGATLFADITCVQPCISGLLTNEPKIFAYLSVVLLDFPALYSTISILQSYMPRYSPTSPSFSPQVFLLLLQFIDIFITQVFLTASPAQLSPSSPRYSPTSLMTSPRYSPASPVTLLHSLTISFLPYCSTLAPACPAYNPMSPSRSPANPSQNGSVHRSHSYQSSPSWNQ
ncbi:hypothetical protein BT96DRAFT_995959 [Gymnopus androsaceus JB14]|uniref:Uncharacterized protein n=1 Tax=Gymnopus androsaceus JB14 TaxID=1447944 RepID=A0A6A4HJG0_9AGAR|nr:hypothetical protein BT96DRAFT_995959 [Gymnopus androsaceus JB14]